MWSRSVGRELHNWPNFSAKALLVISERCTLESDTQVSPQKSWLCRLWMISASLLLFFGRISHYAILLKDYAPSSQEGYDFDCDCVFVISIYGKVENTFGWNCLQGHKKWSFWFWWPENVFVFFQWYLYHCGIETIFPVFSVPLMCATNIILVNNISLNNWIISHCN